jgi:hypothetical protein
MSPSIRNNVNLGPQNPSKFTTQVNYENVNSAEFVEKQEGSLTEGDLQH